MGCTAFAESKPFENAKLSVLVCSPGEPIYSQYGHAAIRLLDNEQNVDVVFDYGVFTFDDLPKFVWNFLTGNMYYLCWTRSMEQTLWEYEYEGRAINEFPLDLTPDETQRICSFLLWNIRPENQSYLYNFFEDNCATRICTLLEREFPTIKWNENYQPTTWRQLIFQYADGNSWIGYGIHLGLGLPADTIMSTRQMMFVPDYLGKALETATHDGKQLSPQNEQILRASQVSKTAWWDNSALFLWILAVLFAVQTIIELKKDKRCIWCDVVFYTVTGFVGCVIWFISFVSIHSLVFPNCDTIWLTPFHFIFAITLMIPALQNRTKWYYIFAAGMIFVYLAVSVIVGQYIAPSSWPLMLIFISRSVYPIQEKRRSRASIL